MPMIPMLLIGNILLISNLYTYDPYATNW